MIVPANPHATPEARRVLEYLDCIRGKAMIAGQHTQTIPQEELSSLQQRTGKLPALCGFELLAYSPNIRLETCDEAALKEIRENRDTLQCAYDWAARGGLVTFTWHWYSPIGGRDKSFYSKNTEFDAAQVLVEGTPERTAFYHDMDVMADLLQGFQEKQIPILWRPFHEAEGQWFWWGAKGMDVARQLYREMFRYYTEVKHLDHLIWVWNNPKAEGYVGDAYCDIATADAYPPPHNHDIFAPQYEALRGCTDTKPYALGEVGAVPDAEKVRSSGLDWLWFMTWSGGFILTQEHNSTDALCRLYDHPFTVTLDKLPKLY